MGEFYQFLAKNHKKYGVFHIIQPRLKNIRGGEFHSPTAKKKDRETHHIVVFGRTILRYSDQSENPEIRKSENPKIRKSEKFEKFEKSEKLKEW